MSAHTPTPWSNAPLAKPNIIISESDWKRAVQCVNACEGMDDPDAIIRFMRYELNRFRTGITDSENRELESLRAERDGMVEALRYVRTVLYMCENSLLNCGYGVESSTIKSIQKAVAKLSKYAKK